jgi:NADH-quinone oxidoreductase subunit A
MEQIVPPILPIFLFVVCMIGLAVGLLVFSRIVRPGRPGRVTQMPYESGMDPIHDTRRRFDVRFHLLAIAFLVFDVELLFLYPWAVVAGESYVAREMGTSAAIQTRDERPDARKARDADLGTGRRGETKTVGNSSSPSFPLSPSPALPGSGFAVEKSRRLIFAGVMTFVALLTLGFVYDWRKGVFQWR